MTKRQPKYDRTLLGAGNLSSEPGSPDWAIAVRLRIQGFLETQNSNAFHLENMISMMKEREGWRHLTAADGTPFQSYDHFATEKAPFGLGVGSGKIEEIIALRKTAGNPHNSNYCNTRIKSGTVQYYRARLQRDRPDILEALDRGEYPSTRQACIAAGIQKESSNFKKAQTAFEKLTEPERISFLDWAWAATPKKITKLRSA